MITNYFLPYSTNPDNQYLNVTLTLYDNLTILQQQSILIEEYPNDSLNIRNTQLSIISSSTSIKITYLLLFISIDLIRR
jgi:hypothetical protein